MCTLIKNKTLYVLLLFSVICFSSCNKEQRIVDNYAALVEKIETQSDDFTEDDWENFSKKCEKLENEMKECQFTKEQKKELGKLRGRLIVATGKHSGKLLKNAAEDVMEQLKSFSEGFMEGLDSSDEE